MSDYVPDTPLVAKLYCPGCEPDSDPMKEILDVLWCEAHCPPRNGVDDNSVSAAAYLTGGAEIDGETNTRWCELIHGRLRPGRQG